MGDPIGTVLITGGTSGLGYEAAKHIAQTAANNDVVLVARTNADDAAASINKSTGYNTASFIALDLSKLKHVRDFVEDFALKKHPPIRVLLLNAGIQITTGITYTTDGFETTFGVNHLGHALLFYLLRPYLADDCHIIITSSGTHDPAQKTMVPDAIYNNAEELAHPTSVTAKNDGRQRYATSKLCNVMWMYALHRHLAKATSQSIGPKWTVAAFDPGLMPGTGLARDASGILIFLWKSVLPRLLPVLRFLISPNIHKPSESGTALAKLGVQDRASEIDGKYFEGLKAIKSSEASYDVVKQEELWDWTVKTLAKDEEEKHDFEKVYLTK